MKPDVQWDLEMKLLAAEWQPAIMSTIVDFYTKSKRRTSSKLAFVETYERYFLNPTKEDIYG